jgi:energy-coupling factor transport system substrate-specific component
VGVGIVAFALVTLLGMAALSGLALEAALDTLAFVMLVAIPAGVAGYALVEFLQTGRLASISGQFDTRTLVLMPVAMALNIVLGTAVASALKIPIYLDSVGTILVAVLAGPLAGAATGFLTNVVWSFLAPPPFGSPFAAPFAIVAVVVGLLAGTFARWGWLRPRRGASGRRLFVGGALAIGALALMAVVALRAWLAAAQGGDLRPDADDTAFVVLGWVAMLLVAGTGVGLVVLLVRWRDLAAAYILAAGMLTGVAAAFMAAPIAASLFGGVTGSGADFVIAALRQAGADLQAAVLGQSLISDPVDKTVTYFVVYLVLGAMATRTKARFPQGAYLLPRPEAADGPEPGTS